MAMYHHVKDRKHSFPWVNGVSDRRFKEQLNTLQKKYRIISLEEYVRYLYDEAEIPYRAAVLTFDDGLKDHYRTVFPLLKKRGIPAAFFPISRSVHEAVLTIAHKNHFLFHTFSVPELRQLIYREIPQRLRVIEQSKNYALSARARYRFDDRDTAALKYFVNHCLPHKLRKRVIANVFKKAGLPEKKLAREFYLSEAEVQEMSRSGFEFGSHSHNHFVLAHAAARLQEQELRSSKVWLGRVIKKPVTALSYPFGHIGEFNKTTISLAKKLGFRVGLANIPRINKGHVDPFSVARVDAAFL